ncbi:MAG: PilN domain-containing protein [Desulfobacterales bacterium]
MIANTEKELNTFNEINKEIAEIKSKLQVLKTKTEIIDELQIKRKEPVLMLDAMTSLIVAERMWFTSFKATERIQSVSVPAKGKKTKKAKEASSKQPLKKFHSAVDIVVRGIALDNKTVADFMTQLENSPLFSEVNLKTIKQVTIKGLNLMEFEVNFSKMQTGKNKGQAA